MKVSHEHELVKQQLRELIDKAQSNQAILEKFQRFELTMLSSDNLAELLRTLLQQALEHFNVIACRLMWFENQQELQTLIPEPIRQHYAQSLVLHHQAEVAQSLFSAGYFPVLKASTADECRLWFADVNAIASMAFIPLMADAKLIGVYVLGSDDIKRFSADKAVDFMAHMGLIAAVCLQNSLNKERIRQLSMMDNLTRIKNRRCFDNDIQKEVARAIRAKQPLSCLFIDADFFKAINDTHGHQVGDKALCALAAWIKAMLRECDHLARYGGEEFVALLPNCDQFLALQVAERIRYFIENNILATEEVTLQLTVSIGISTFDSECTSTMERNDIVMQLLKKSDMAVYDAKALGRNRVCVRAFE